MTVQPKPSLDQLLCLDLYAASRAVIKAYGPFLEQTGLTYPQYLVMMALWEKGPLAVKALSGLLSLDSGTLSPLLKRLEVAGLVARTRSKVDERGVTIALTDAGRALEAKAAVVGPEMWCLFGTTPQEARALQLALRTIAKRMDANG